MENNNTVPLNYRRVDEGYYEVRFGTLVLGNVHRCDSCWSYSAWVIEGDRKTTARGGVNNATIKQGGYPTRNAAARQLAIMRSGDIQRDSAASGDIVAKPEQSGVLT